MTICVSITTTRHPIQHSIINPNTDNLQLARERANGKSSPLMVLLIFINDRRRFVFKYKYYFTFSSQSDWTPYNRNDTNTSFVRHVTVCLKTWINRLVSCCVTHVLFFKEGDFTCIGGISPLADSNGYSCIKMHAIKTTLFFYLKHLFGILNYASTVTFHSIAIYFVQEGYGNGKS